MPYGKLLLKEYNKLWNSHRHQDSLRKILWGGGLIRVGFQLVFIFIFIAFHFIYHSIGTAVSEILFEPSPPQHIFEEMCKSLP